MLNWAERLAAINRGLAIVAEQLGDVALAWRLYAEADELEGDRKRPIVVESERIQ